MSGVELIKKERDEQIRKHGYMICDDVENNNNCQLTQAAQGLLKGIKDFSRTTPPNNWSSIVWIKMISKSYKERLIIAGALIAAEIDRLNRIERDGK